MSEELKSVCQLCNRTTEGKEDINYVFVTEKGAIGINNAASLRGDAISVVKGAYVHVACRQQYINKKNIELLKKKTNDEPPLKRPTRTSMGNYNNRQDCLFCGHTIKVEISLARTSQRTDYSSVKTHGFVEHIRKCCKSRDDEWAHLVIGRIEFFDSDLHAADCLYHRCCSSNFQSGRDMPQQFRLLTEPELKRKKPGRPSDIVQNEAFLQVCEYFELNDDEQVTVPELVIKMDETLRKMNCGDVHSYSVKYMKKKLIEKYGDNIQISQKEGSGDIITWIEHADHILREYGKIANAGDPETRKKSILEAAARLLRSDIKNVDSKEEYPSLNDLNMSNCLSYLPESLSFFLSNILGRKDTSRKVASVGHILVQAVRPRTIIAPLQIALAVQLHYMYRSRFLIDSLYSMGLCSSYNEVGRFILNAACMGTLTPIGELKDGMVALFAGDNVDANTITLDGQGTFHGMGIICAVTPKKEFPQPHHVPRKPTGVLDITGKAKVPIHQYNTTNHLKLSALRFESLAQLPPIDQKLDILWEMSFRYKSTAPNWSGMMHCIHSNLSHPGKSSIYFLPLIDLQSSDMTCLYSTLRYISKISSSNNIPAIITFDQPLFWKASQIVNEVVDTDEVKDVIVRMGTFHMLMNLLGAIGYLMDGSGIRELFETIYGGNAVIHMMSGKAVQRATRAHLLLDKCLAHEIISEIVALNPELEKDLDSLEAKYDSLKKGDDSIEDIQADISLSRIENTIKRTKETTTSRTSKMWLSYRQLVQTVRNLVKSDRTGSWNDHLRAGFDCMKIFAAAGHYNYLKSTYLYLMKMMSLERTHPLVYDSFQQGLFVARRSDKFWAGLSLDLVIEQALMRALKTRGGLTRGSGMTERQQAIWTMSAPACSEYNFAMQDFTDTKYITSEQHKEYCKSRVARDNSDFQKLLETVQSFKLLSLGPGLINVVNGVESSSVVNVDDWEEVGSAIVQKMPGNAVFSYSFSRKDRVVNMASSGAVKLAKDRSVDPQLLFQRLLIVAQTGKIGLKDILEHELCSYPPSLFEGKDLMRKADKPPLAHAILKRTSGKPEPESFTVPVTDKFVLDGGSLLHRLVWTEGATYDEIAQMYADFTIRNYGCSTTVVFDGYTGPNIKDSTHQRRNPKVNREIDVKNHMRFTGKRDEFLSNPHNKNSIIQLIIKQLNDNGCHAIQSVGDADVDIVNAAVSTSSSNSTTLIGEDTDLLLLLIFSAHVENYPIYFRSDKQQKSNTKIYDIKSIKASLGEGLCTQLLFLHAFTGCDTTSRIFGIGKQTAFKKLVEKSSRLTDIAAVFCSDTSTKIDICNAGIKTILNLFGGKETEGLTELRLRLLSKNIVSAQSFVTPEKLPPTESSTKFHSMRSYYQIMLWMGKSDKLNPLDWGWALENGTYIPIMSDKHPVPAELINIVHCNCTTHCGSNRCGCRKYGLPCTSACGQCQTDSCENAQKLEPDESDDDDE